MKTKMTFTKKDVIVVAGCVVFLIANIGAIGSGGRKRAKDAVCQSNLRQWGNIFMMYASDFNGSFPTGGCLSEWLPESMQGQGLNTGNYQYAAMGDWTVCMRRYYYKDNRDLMFCAEARKLGPDWQNNTWIGAAHYSWEWWWRNPYNEAEILTLNGSYGLNGWVYNCPDAGNENNWKTANVAGADNIPLLLDSAVSGGSPNSWDAPPAFPDDIQVGWMTSHMKYFCIDRHGGGTINSLFLDFSVRKVGLKDLWKLKWHRNFDVDAPSPDWATEAPWMKDFQDY